MDKKIKLFKNIWVSNFTRLSSPYKVTFALTYRCNLRCKICKIWEKTAKEEMSVGEIEGIFKKLNNLSWLDLTGGEITLRQELLDIVRVILKHARKISVLHISTNGQLPEKAVLLVKEITKFKLSPIVNISLDGPEEINDQLRGSQGAYRRSLETFKGIKKLKNNYCYLSCTLSGFNVNYIDKLLAGLRRDISGFNLADLHFNLFHKSAHYYGNLNLDGPAALSPELVKDYFTLSKKGNLIKFFLEAEYIKGLSKYLNGDNFPLRCQSLNATCFIDPAGRVYPCGIYNVDVGDLKEYDFNLDKLWNSENSLRARENIEKRNCPGCWSPCEAYPAILGSIINWKR